MARIAADDERILEEQIFGLFGSDLVPFPILLLVALVPTKPDTIV
jgi:hypothetical protein